MGEHLLRAAAGIPAHRRERIGDRQEPQSHLSPSRASAALASPTRC
jgi:hypothetical protein